MFESKQNRINLRGEVIAIYKNARENEKYKKYHS